MTLLDDSRKRESFIHFFVQLIPKFLFGNVCFNESFFLRILFFKSVSLQPVVLATPPSFETHLVAPVSTETLSDRFPLFVAKFLIHFVIVPRLVDINLESWWNSRNTVRLKRAEAAGLLAAVKAAE